MPLTVQNCGELKIEQVRTWLHKKVKLLGAPKMTGIIEFKVYWLAVKELKLSYHNGYI